MSQKLIQKDLKYIWHPASQMQDYLTFQPLIIQRTLGSYLYLTNGKKIIDAISSWWCKSLGHQHPELKSALEKQMNAFEHVIFANTTNETIVNLSEKLATLTQTLPKVFYAGDGSCAIEIAMKMSIHSRLVNNESKRKKFIALQNGYHGETVGAMSVSDVGLYRTPYQSLLFATNFISDLPYVSGEADLLWADCSAYWEKIEKKLVPYQNTTTAIILEPIVQGAGGMKIYSANFLKRLREWTLKYNVHLIADEIMTGIGRTGKMFACEHASIEPDFLCLSKGLTSGWLPFSAVLTSNRIYDSFYADYQIGKSFLHSHTFSGNALGAALALTVLNIFEKDNLLAIANELGQFMQTKMQDIASYTNKIHNVRRIGALVAADLICKDQDKGRRLGYEVYQKAVALGALLRPLGNTIYWLPPLTTSKETITELAAITSQAIEQIDF